MSEEATFREMRPEDAEAVTALWRAAGIARPWNPPDRDIAFALRGGHSTILVAEIAGAVAASAMVGEDGHRG